MFSSDARLKQATNPRLDLDGVGGLCDCVRMSRTRRMATLAALIVGLAMLCGPTSSNAQQSDPQFPNLPDRGRDQMVASYTTNLSYIEASKQWIKMPKLKVVSHVFIGLPGNPNCTARFGVGSPRCLHDGDGTKLAIRAKAYPTNFVGDDPAAGAGEQRRWGAEFTDFPSQRIRTLGFGAIPLEATVHLSLSTDSGLPVGIQIDADNFTFTPIDGVPRSPINTNSVGQGYLEVRLSDVTADGSPVNVGTACRSAEPARLDLAGVGYRSPATGGGGAVPTGRYNPRQGGLLQGTVTVERFSGCGAGGENLDPLINAMAAGAMPVSVTQAEVRPQCFNDNPARAIVEADCNEPDPDPAFPDGEALPPLDSWSHEAPPVERMPVPPRT